MTESTCLPDDKESLREMVIALQAQNSSYKKFLRAEQAKVSALDQHIVTLEQQLAALRRARYGLSLIHISEPTRPY